MEFLLQDICEWEDVVDCSSDFTALAGVKFKKDFGPWKQGEEVAYLQFNYDSASVGETDEDGNDSIAGKHAKLTLVAV